MRVTNYTKITLEGFQSAGKPISFQLDNLGLTLIKGENGAGKSTVFNAIPWVEFGINPKKSVATWEDLRPEGFRGTRVVIERNDGEYDYMIARHLAFKGTTRGLTGGDKLMIFKKPMSEPKFLDSHLVGSALNKAEMQKMIVDQIGMDSKTFSNSILFGQRMTSFVESDGKDKRELFDELFDVGFVDSAKEKAKAEETKLNTEISNLETKLNGYEDKKELLEEKLEGYRTQLKTFDENKKQRVNTAKNNLKEAEDKLKAVESEIVTYTKEVAKYDFKTLEKLEAEIETIKASEKLAKSTLEIDETALKDLTTEIEKSVRKQKELEVQLEQVKTNCPTCGEKLKADKVEGAKKSIREQIQAEKLIQTTHGAKKTVAGNKVAESKKKYDSIDKNLKVKQEEASKFSGDKTKSATAQANLSNKTTRKEELTADISKLKETLKTEEDAKKPKLDVEGVGKELLDLSDSIAGDDELLEVKKTKLTKVKWWITKGFGASGLKAFVFNAMLAQLNSFSHKYSARLGFRVEFSIDTTKASRPFQTLIYSGDNVRDYLDLSGGQKQRVDVVIAFAMHDLISFNSNINILVMDEITEGLDGAGLEAVYDLIREKSEAKAVYIITHETMIDSYNSRSVTFGLDEDKNTYIKW